MGSHDNKVYALNATTGALIWDYNTVGLVESSPGVADGKVFVGSGDGKVFAFGYRHDIAITNVVSCKTVVGQGFAVGINVTVQNQGNIIESFNVTAYYSNSSFTSAIASQNVTLTDGSFTTITFTWNTTGFDKGNYSIWAYAWPVPGEIDPADNNFTDGYVFVAMVGDINADGIVDIEDIYAIALTYGTTPGQPGYKPNQDINWDGIIDIEDIYTAALHYGETSP